MGRPARLGKRDAEALTDALAGPVEGLVAALSSALARVLGEDPAAGFDVLVERAPLDRRRQRRLAARDQAALWELATELNERRTL